jgi:hypothetical protein
MAYFTMSPPSLLNTRDTNFVPLSSVSVYYRAEIQKIATYILDSLYITGGE